MSVSVERIYRKYIQQIPESDQLKLVALITQTLAESSPTEKKLDIMALHGLGAEIWQDVDPQEYVDQLRDEWA